MADRKRPITDTTGATGVRRPLSSQPFDVREQRRLKRAKALIAKRKANQAANELGGGSGQARDLIRKRHDQFR